MNRNRRGTSLISMMVSITIISAVLSITGTLFHRMFRSDQVTARAALREITTARLANLFRNDLHEAETVRVTMSSDERPQLQLQSGQRQIVYTALKNQVRRDVTDLLKTAHHDLFRLPDCKVLFVNGSLTADDPAFNADDPANADHPENAGASSPRFVTMVIRRPHSIAASVDPSLRPNFDLAIDAELNRNLRLARSVLRAEDENTENQP